MIFHEMKIGISLMALYFTISNKLNFCRAMENILTAGEMPLNLSRLNLTTDFI